MNRSPVPPLIVISPRRLTRFLVISIAVTTFLGWLCQMIAYSWVPELFMRSRSFVRMFSLGEEANIPTLFSCSLFAMAALFSFLIANRLAQTGGAHVREWRGLGFLFTFFTVDDFAQIHEGISTTLSSHFSFGGFLLYPWILVYGVGGIVMVIAYLKFLAHLPPTSRWRIVLAGVIFVSGAMGMEVLEAKFDSLYGNRNLIYMHMEVVEETLENIGIVLMIHTLVQYLQSLGSLQLIALKEEEQS